MADTTRISSTQSLQAQSQALTVRGGPGAASQANMLGGYNRQAQATSPSQPMATDEFQRAVDKLTRTLDSGSELRTNVPRGFYLNVRV